MISLFDTYISPNALANVESVLYNRWLNEGKWVELFEQKLESIGLSYPTTVNSGTSALHLSLENIGIQSDDEVILSPQTFIATGTSILQAGGIPIFADIDPNTGNITSKTIRNVLSEKTKAIIVVHWGGLPADLDPIHQLGKEVGVPIIEDAAHALGATYKDTPIGSISDYTCFSFQSIKFVTTGDGGCIASTNPDIYHSLQKKRWFGIDRKNMLRNPEGDKACVANELGFKYHMNNIAAAIGCANIDNIQERLIKRRCYAKQYKDAFKFDGIELLNPQYECDPSYWIFTMKVDRRLDFIKKLSNKGIMASVVDRRIDNNPIFKKTYLPNQEIFDEKQVSIPIHDSLTNEEVDYIIDAIKTGW